MNAKISLIRNVVSSFVLVLPLLSWANPPHDFPCAAQDKPPFADHKPGAFNSDRLPPYLDGLDLSDSQQAKIAEIVKAQGSQLHEKAETVRKAHDALRKLAFSSDYNDDKAKSFAEASGRYMAELAVFHARLDHEIFTVLNVEQQQQAQDNMAKFKGHFPPH
jgi:P pilus assembly/Cpx signaling pathway, periplasmic inhibitor/zinc-resistance associated protein